MTVCACVCVPLFAQAGSSALESVVYFVACDPYVPSPGVIKFPAFDNAYTFVRVPSRVCVCVACVAGISCVHALRIERICCPIWRFLSVCLLGDSLHFFC